MDNSRYVSPWAGQGPVPWESLTSYRSPATHAIHSPYAVQSTFPARSIFAPTGRLPRPEITVSVPHAARMYDYFLDGSHNFQVDRSIAERELTRQPTLRRDVRAVRAFLGRAVAYLAREKGIRQFLDIGAGIPASGSTHQAARDIAPGSVTVYVDNDQVALDHSRAILADDNDASMTAYLNGDLRRPRRILQRAANFIDLREPVAIVLVSVIHTVRDEQDPGGIISTLMAPTAAGSCLVLTQHAADINYPIAGTERARPNWRSHAETMRFFDGLNLVEPGLVQVHRWRPRAGAAALSRDIPDWAGVAEKKS